MKIRSGFVSNSSSSSFVCCICGRSEGGYDMSLEDAGMVKCEAGHTFCTSHLQFDIDESYDDLTKKEFCNNFGYVTISDKSYEFVKQDSDKYYELPSDLCPVCNMKYITEHHELLYLRKKYGKDAVKEIQEKFVNLQDFNKFLKEN